MKTQIDSNRELTAKNLAACDGLTLVEPRPARRATFPKMQKSADTAADKRGEESSSRHRRGGRADFDIGRSRVLLPIHRARQLRR